MLENCRYTITPTLKRLKLFFSVNQLSLYGAVAEMCEEHESCHDRTVGPIVRGQSASFVSSVIKTNIPLNHDPAQEVYLLQCYRKRIEKLSQQKQIKQILY